MRRLLLDREPPAPAPAPGAAAPMLPVPAAAGGRRGPAGRRGHGALSPLISAAAAPQHGGGDTAVSRGGRATANGACRRVPCPAEEEERPCKLLCNTGVGSEKQNKMHSHTSPSCATTKCMDTGKFRKKATKNITNNNPLMEKRWFQPIYENSSHCDGAIYRNWFIKDEWPDVDITNRNETPLEPMMFSEATENCVPDPQNCMLHFPRDMLQFMSVMLVDTTVSNGSMPLFGYIAVRDERDWMLNYIFNCSRDDPIIVQQGSLIEMMGPKRGIQMSPPVLIELDIRIKNGELEEEDLELIDGAIACTLRRPRKPMKHYIAGKCGAIGMTLAFVEDAVEATIEVVISEVHRGVNLSLSSLVYIAKD